MKLKNPLISILISLLLTSVFFASLLAVAERPSVRLQGTDRFRHDAIYKETGDIQVAMSGTSRSRRAHYAPYLAADLEREFGLKNPIVLDLSLVGDGIDAQTSILRMLLEERHVETVVMQLYYKGDRAKVTHPRYHQIGTLKDVLLAPFDKNPGGDRFPDKARQKQGNALSRRAQLLYLRINGALDFCIERFSRCFAADQTRPAHWFDDSKPVTVTPEKLSEPLEDLAEAGTVFFRAPRDWELSTLLNARTNYFLTELINLANSKGTDVVLLDIPAVGMQPLDEDLAKEVEDTFGVSFLYPSREDLRDLYFNAYGDKAHVGLKGEAFYRELLIKHFRQDSEAGS